MSDLIKHKPLGYGKKLYIAEFLAERAIQIVAILSIGFIFAIFYYVFQESFYAFQEEKSEAAYASTSGAPASDNTPSGSDMQPESYTSENSGEELKPESYGSESSSSTNSAELKPETYGAEPATPREAELKPESYGGEISSAGGDELKPETYGETSAEPALDNTNHAALNAAPTPSVESAEAPTLTPMQLIRPNDVIDGKPAYIWQPISSVPKYSFIPLFVGAFKVTVIAIAIAAPIAILAAIFTVAFAPKWLKEIIKPAIEILAGFPSIVIGFFCLMTLATIVQEVFGTTYRLNSFVGGVGMALAVIPIIYTVTEDALSAVPKFMSEASLALGASKWETAYRVLLPAATPGVFAAIILGFGRAFGETMIALLATGNAALVSTDIFESVRTMAATIGAEMAEVEFRSSHYGVLFLIGSVLFVITFTLNAVAEFYVRRKLLKKFQGL